MYFFIMKGKLCDLIKSFKDLKLSQTKCTAMDNFLSEK